MAIPVSLVIAQPGLQRLHSIYRQERTLSIPASQASHPEVLQLSSRVHFVFAKSAPSQQCQLTMARSDLFTGRHTELRFSRHDWSFQVPDLKNFEDAPLQKVANTYSLARRWTFRSLSEEQVCKIASENIDSRLIARVRRV